MKSITDKHIENFKSYLRNEERAAATVEKYIRDVAAFSAWLGGREIGKNAVLAYKEYLIETYAPASVNSVLSSLNSFFRFAGWHDCHVKTLKIQQLHFLIRSCKKCKTAFERGKKLGRFAVRRIVRIRVVVSKSHLQKHLNMQNLCHVINIVIAVPRIFIDARG